MSGSSLGYTPEKDVQSLRGCGKSPNFLRKDFSWNPQFIDLPMSARILFSLALMTDTPLCPPLAWALGICTQVLILHDTLPSDNPQSTLFRLPIFALTINSRDF